MTIDKAFDILYSSNLQGIEREAIDCISKFVDQQDKEIIKLTRAIRSNKNKKERCKNENEML